MKLFFKKYSYRVNFYYSIFSPHRLCVTVLNVAENTVENHIIEFENVNSVDEFFDNEKTVINEVFDVLNKLKNYDKSIHLTILDNSLVYTYTAPKMNKAKVESFLNKELKENFEDLAENYNLYSNNLTNPNGTSYISVILLKKKVQAGFSKLFKNMNLNLEETDIYENLFGAFAIKDIQDDNFIVVNIRNKTSSVICVVNREVVDFATFESDLTKAKSLKTYIKTMIYKHSFEYNKAEITKVYVYSGLPLDEKYQKDLKNNANLETTIMPFGLRDFDRFKFNYETHYKSKSLIETSGFNFNFDLGFGKKKEKGFTLIECVVSIAIISILGLTVFSSVLLANNLQAREVHENLVSTTVKNFHQAYIANPTDAINAIYKAYDSALTTDKLDTNLTDPIEYYFYIDSGNNLLSAKKNDIFTFKTVYQVSKDETKPDILKYSFKVVEGKVNDQNLLGEQVDFGEIYVHA